MIHRDTKQKALPVGLMYGFAVTLPNAPLIVAACPVSSSVMGRLSITVTEIILLKITLQTLAPQNHYLRIQNQAPPQISHAENQILAPP